MADNNKLELVVEVDVNKANASIKSVNTGAAWQVRSVEFNVRETGSMKKTSLLLILAAVLSAATFAAPTSVIPWPDCLPCLRLK